MSENEILGRSSLLFYELDGYLKGRNGYAIRISNLKIFDEPMELKDVRLTRAPQNMCNIGYFDPEAGWGTWAVLISIRPEWICEILNGKKDVEVRSQVLNCMKEGIR